MKPGRLYLNRITALCFVLPVFCAVLLTACGAAPVTGEHLSRAMKAMEELEYQSVVEEAQTAIVTGEDARLSYRLMGIAYMRTGDYTAAADAFRSALSRSDGIATGMDYDMNLYLADCMRHLGAYADAVGIYDHMLDLRPSDAETLFERGATKLKLQQLMPATEDFDACLALQPRDMEQRIRIYLAYAEAGYEDAGKAVLQEALSSFGNALSYYEKGRAAYYLGNNAEAQSQLEKALQSTRGEERVQVVLMLGLTGERQEDYTYALDIYTQYLAEDANAEVLNRRGICRMRQGDYAGAIADFEEGLQLQDAQAYRALLRNEITAYEHLGEFTKAADLMKEYLARYPDDTEALRENAFLSTR